MSPSANFTPARKALYEPKFLDNLTIFKAQFNNDLFVSISSSELSLEPSSTIIT